MNQHITILLDKNIDYFIEADRLNKEGKRDYKKYSRYQAYDLILKSIYEDKDFPNLKTYVVTDILKEKNIYFTQPEIKDYIADFQYEDLIRNLEYDRSDLYFDLTPKAKNILDVHLSFFEWDRKNRTTSFRKKLLTIGQFLISGIALIISIVALNIQISRLDKIQHRVGISEQSQIQLSTQSKLIDQSLKYQQLLIGQIIAGFPKFQHPDTLTPSKVIPAK